MSTDRRTCPRLGGGSCTCQGPRGARARLAGPRGGLQPFGGCSGASGDTYSAVRTPSSLASEPVKSQPAPGKALARRARAAAPGGLAGAERRGSRRAPRAGRPEVPLPSCSGPDGERRPGEAVARPERAARPGGRGVGGPTPRGREGARGGRPRSCLRRQRGALRPGVPGAGAGRGRLPRVQKAKGHDPKVRASRVDGVEVLSPRAAPGWEARKAEGLRAPSSTRDDA